MPLLIAKAGRFAGVDLLPHVDRLSDPVFRVVCEAVAEAGEELELSTLRVHAKMHGFEVR